MECAGTAEKVETEVYQNFAIETADHLRLFTDDGSNESLIASLSGLYYVVFSSEREIDAESFVEISDYQVLSSKELEIDELEQRYYQ